MTPAYTAVDRGGVCNARAALSRQRRAGGPWFMAVSTTKHGNPTPAHGDVIEIPSIHSTLNTNAGQ